MLRHFISVCWVTMDPHHNPRLCSHYALRAEDSWCYRQPQLVPHLLKACVRFSELECALRHQSGWCWACLGLFRLPLPSSITGWMTRGNGPTGFLSPASLWNASSWIMLYFDFYMVVVSWCRLFSVYHRACIVLGFLLLPTRLDFLLSWPQFNCLGCTRTGDTSRGQHPLAITLDMKSYFDNIPTDVY